MGFEYELVREFARRHDLRLQMVVPPSRDQLIPWLLEGKGDLVAASLTIEPELENGIRFSRRVNTVSEIVVTRADDESINTPEDLAGRTFYVRPSSSYWRSLLRLKEMGINIELKPAPKLIVPVGFSVTVMIRSFSSSMLSPLSTGITSTEEK